MSFSLDIEKFVAKAKAAPDVVVRKLAIDAFTRVIMRSPVKTGRFRGNWQVGIGNVPDGVLEIEDKEGIATVSAATAAANGLKAGTTIYLTNNLPYAQRLENGWSGQAPAGMVGITVEEFQQMIDRAVKE